MNKAKSWLGVLLFLVITVVAVMVFIVPVLSDTAPGGPKLSFGGAETCQLGGSLEEFNAAGLYMSEKMQDDPFPSRTAQSDLPVFLGTDRAASCGSGQLLNKADRSKPGRECMVYSFKLLYEDGGRMTCNGTEILGNTKTAINATLGKPTKTYSDNDQYTYTKSGRSYDFYFYYDEAGTCIRASGVQVDPQMSFY